MLSYSIVQRIKLIVVSEIQFNTRSCHFLPLNFELFFALDTHKALVAPQFSGTRSFPRSFPKKGTRSRLRSNLEKRNAAVPRSRQ